jgi:hypothetical protein
MMPFRSEAQRGYLYANHPEVAAKFQAHTPKGTKLPKHVQTHAKRTALLKQMKGV